MSAQAGDDSAAVLRGRPATELGDEELEAQGTQAHATRNWVFLHGTAEQYARHTSRMLELEQEYLRRHPQRTWQGTGGAVADPGDEVAALRAALRGIAAQLDVLAAEPVHDTRPAHPHDPELAVLSAVAATPDGRLHKLEVHQAAREAGLDRAALAALYTSAQPSLMVDQQDRVITDAGRDRLRAAGRRSVHVPRSSPGEWQWQREERPEWDADRRRVIGGAPPGVFAFDYAHGASLPGDWWSVRLPDGTVLGYGWMDLAWGDAEVLLAVDPDAQDQGLGGFVLDQLEREAAERGVNYVYNTVAATHPRRDYVHDWLGARGYLGDDEHDTLRKRVGVSSGSAGNPPRRSAPHREATQAERPSDSAADEAHGREDLGGYVDVEDHSY